MEDRWYSVQRPNAYQLIQARALGLLSLVTTRHHTCFQVGDLHLIIPQQGGAEHAVIALPAYFFFQSQKLEFFQRISLA